jgi:trimeric autotransporter adhesin
MHPKHTFSRPGFYSVRLNVTDANGCFASNELRIEVTQEFDLFIPTAFTPNNDGMNEFFEIKGGGFREYKVVIFNRWGEQVFYSEDLSLAWDGTFKGSDAPTGVYYYSIFLVLNDGKLHSEKGSVSIIR